MGEGKPENQNHAIIFTRGEGLQTIDMNQVRQFTLLQKFILWPIVNLLMFLKLLQDNYMEEALKMRNLLQEFLKKHGVRNPSILGLREHIFTGR